MTITTTNIVLVAKQYATKCHEMTNHLYDDQPYTVHLEAVYNYALKYKHLLDPEVVDLALAACWVHDVIEDTRQTYNDVKKVCGCDVADITYLLTNNKGRNRAEREGISYYMPIVANTIASFVKTCDRLANAAHSKNTNSRMLGMYKKEHEKFCAYLRTDMFEEMFIELDEILK